jgi:hypothetical protein
MAGIELGDPIPEGNWSTQVLLPSLQSPSRPDMVFECQDAVVAIENEVDSPVRPIQPAAHKANATAAYGPGPVMTVLIVKEAREPCKQSDADLSWKGSRLALVDATHRAGRSPGQLEEAPGLA